MMISGITEIFRPHFWPPEPSVFVFSSTFPDRSEHNNPRHEFPETYEHAISKVSYKNPGRELPHLHICNQHHHIWGVYIAKRNSSKVGQMMEVARSCHPITLNEVALCKYMVLLSMQWWWCMKIRVIILPMIALIILPLRMVSFHLPQGDVPERSRLQFRSKYCEFGSHHFVARLNGNFIERMTQIRSQQLSAENQIQPVHEDQENKHGKKGNAHANKQEKRKTVPQSYINH